jgi:hypothetical protein
MKFSTETAELAKALVKAQSEMKNPAFDTTNPHFKNRFASLAAVRNAVIPVFNKHGVFVTQDVTTVEGGISCTTVLMHESGQFVEFGPLMMPATKADAQGLGSATTYCKRYQLQAVSGVVGDDDDDGNAAARLNTNGKAETVTTTQANELVTLATEVHANVPAFLKYLGVDDFTKIPAYRYTEAKSALERKRA